MRTLRAIVIIPSAFCFFLLSSCSPTVKVEAPDKPIVINLNIKIEHEVRIKIDKELDDLFKDEKGLF